jgi:hypothetical protein
MLSCNSTERWAAAGNRRVTFKSFKWFKKFKSFECHDLAENAELGVVE